MNKVLGYYRSNKVVCNVFIFILIFKCIFFLSCNILQTPDSLEYIGMNGFDIFRLHLNEYRVPVYPLIIEIFERLLGQNGLLIVCMLQLVVSFISSIYLFKILNMFSKKKYISLFITAIYSCSLMITGWEKSIITESFALALTIFLIYNILNYLKFKRIIFAINLSIITTIGTLLRPTYLLYACIIFGFFILQFIFLKKEREIAIKSSLISFLPIVLINVYTFLFYQQFQQVSLTNSLLGQQVEVMIETGLYKLSNDDEIVNTINKMAKTESVIPQPYLTRLEIMNLFDRPRISEFVNQIKKNNIIGYSKEIIKIVKEQSNVDFTSSYITKHRITTYLLYVYSALLRYTLTFFQGMVISVICFLILMYRIMKLKYFDWVYFGLFGFITLTYITSILGTSAEYQRTAITSLPFMTLALYLFLINLIDFIKSFKDEKLIGENYDTR